MSQSWPQNAQIANCARSFRGRSRRRSNSRCQRPQGRPCSEVDLRQKPVEIPSVTPNPAFAKDLVSDLVNDAVDEIAADAFVYDVDLSWPASRCPLQIDTEASAIDDDVYSLASESWDELEKVDIEVEELAYYDMAANMAKKAVEKGCLQMSEELISMDKEEEEHEIEDWGSAPIEDWGNMPLETFGYWEADDTYMMDPVLDTAPGLFDMTIDVDGGCEEFLGEDFFGCDEMAFDMTKDILEDAFDEMAVTWKQQMNHVVSICDLDRTACSPEELPQPVKPPVELHTAEERTKTKIHDTLSKALCSGQFTKELSKSLEADRWNTLQQKMQTTFSTAASTGALSRAFQETFTRTQPDSVLQNSAQPAAASSLKLRTTCVATFNTRPVVQAPQATPPPLVMTSESTPDTLKSSESFSSSRTVRSRRRVTIGAVVRTPASGSEAKAGAVQHKQHSKSKQKKLAPDTYSMDFSGCEGGEKDCNSDSSISRGYNALGAKHYSLDAHDDWFPFAANDASFTRSSSSSLAPLSKLKIKVGAPAPERPSSKAGSRLRAASMSAMAMDLGGFAGSGSSIDYKLFSADAYALSAPKAKLHGGLLPMLPSSKKSAESIASTMQMSRTASKWINTGTSRWTNTGLRGSASAVF